MVCSACGFENQPGHRFCGMCGTPLPHRPLSTPGAQSTLSFTRVPREATGPVKTARSLVDGAEIPTGQTRSSRIASPTVVETPVREAPAPAPQVQSRTGERSTIIEPARDEEARSSSRPSQSATLGDRPAELVPPISFEEYVKNFKYVPPDTPEEVTMRAEAPPVAEYVMPAEKEAEPEVSDLPSPTPPQQGPVLLRDNPSEVREAQNEPAATLADPVVEPEPRVVQWAEARDRMRQEEVARAAQDSAASLKTSEVISPPVVPPHTSEIPPAEDVRDRLGLGDVSETMPGARPRFLDLNEVAPPVTRPTRRDSVISGPSFLGLSDAPEAEETSTIPESELEPVEASGPRWRLWLVAAVVVLFAGLGLMEWRTQANQGNDGPVDVMRMKVRNLRHGKSGDTNGAPAPPPSLADNNNAKPEIQVVQPTPPPAPGTAANSNNPANSSSPAASTSDSAATSNPSAGAASSAPTNPNGNAAQTSSGRDGDVTRSSGSNAATPASGSPSVKTSTRVDSDTQNARKAPASSATTGTRTKAPKATADSDEVTTKKIVPGSDEMSKANNASDAAAEAAWLWKATAKGNPDAPVQLADMYVKGAGVPRSCEQAVVLLKTAAEKDNVRARNRLASMYASGICVQRNRVEAYRWLSSALSADPSSQWAQQNRSLIWQQMSPDERAAAGKYR